LFVIWYFLVIMPQQRQRKRTQEMLGNLKTGDKVLTSGGVYGTIAGFRGEIVQLQIASQVKIEVARSAITALQPASGETEAVAVKEPTKQNAAAKGKG
jgi:preprotein translocase subunit YajC